MQARYLAPARFELQKAARYYGEQSSSLASAFLAEVDRSLAQVRAFPDAAPILREPVRRKPLRKFPYGLLYYVAKGEVIVVAVMHRRQRPEYWKNRLT